MADMTASERPPGEGAAGSRRLSGEENNDNGLDTTMGIQVGIALLLIILFTLVMLV